MKPAQPTARPTVLVTGGARRLGRAIALEAARLGWTVVLTWRRSGPEARKTVRAVEALGGCALALRVDVTRLPSLRRASRELLRRGIRLDLLVNNAAVFEPTPIGRATPSHWDRVLDANLKGPFFVIQEMLPRMREGGAIVNIADAAGIVPWPSYAAHAASKAGLIMLTKVLARALAPGLRVNAVAPGPVLPAPGVSRAAWRRATAMTVLRRTGTPSDVARAIFFLAGNRFTTGQVLRVDGGRHLVC
jgi:NAD(P)-dependent dehydrogenase (short-subunit alcohol dehydrogenase family)